ncbi:helix-turn-helix domain-containing protein [Streptomyces sp. NPDC090056]|uniref:helix-turn-helix domain-containing protein n=1 Tax=Streptomyces sp. NPDC090056 TaxID=3365934 RepID=UPI00380B0289
MSARSGPPMGFAEAFDLPLCVGLRTAARALGISLGTAYRLIRLDTFPCTVLRVGRCYRIPTACLLGCLGIEERPVYAADLEAGAAYAARLDDPHPHETEYFG